MGPASCLLVPNEAIIDVRMKKVLLFVAIGLLLLAIPATIFFLGQQRDIRAKAAPATTLSLTPATETVNVGDTVKLSVTMTPGTNQVVSAQIYLTYDPTKLTATSITNGANAPRVLNSGVVGSGTASISVGAASNAEPITTTGPVAIVTFTAASPTTAIAPAEVQFATNTFVGGINDTTANVLVGTVGAKITINGTGTTTLTPTLTPTSTITPAITLTPTLTPTKAATQSSEASSSALTISSPTANEDVTSTVPVIQGTAPPGSTVTIVIHSTPQTVVVTTDADGNWTYTPTTPLDPGPHDVTVSVEDAAGTTQTASNSFVVAGDGTSTETATPVSGNVESTILLIGIGVILLATGALIPIFVR